MSGEACYFASAAEFRDWLLAHAADRSELMVGFWKLGSGKPSMSWSESVDEALCVGWIDGVRRRVDDERYQIRFTPRRPGSIWSAINIAKVERLSAEGRMQAAGLAAFERRIEHKSVIYAYEQAATAELSAAERKAFGAKAWAYFQACPPGYRKTLLHWVCTAKKAETRASRLAKLQAACTDGRRLE